MKFALIHSSDLQSPAVLAVQNSDSASLAQSENCILFGCCLPLLHIRKGLQEESKGNVREIFYLLSLS